MTIRKVLTYGIGTILITAVLVTLIVLINTELARAPIGQSSKTTFSDELLSESLRCERMTADFLETDPLCDDFEYTRQLFTRGITFNSDVDGTSDDRYFVILADGRSTQPAKNISVTIREQENFVCVQPPCNPTSRVIYEGTTDELGVLAVPDSVSLPDDPLYDLTVAAEGYKPVVIPNLDRTPPHFVVALP